MRPPNMDAPGEVGTGQAHSETAADAAIVVDLDAARKSYATLQAQLALRGFTLTRQADGTLLISRWNWPPRHCADVQAVAQFARQVGAAS